MPELAIFISVKSKPGQRDKLRSLWEQHLKYRAEANEAQSTYVYAYDIHDENLVHMTEVYETVQAFEENSKAPWFGEYMQEANELLDGEPTFRMGTPKWVK